MFSLLLALIYVCFISLGLPDSLLGSAWPVIHQELSLPLSFAGIISAIISVGTVISCSASGWILKKFKTGTITAISTAMTALALFGFSISNQFWMLVVWAIPYGLGAGCVDAVLNNYVALHYKSQHMSWLHCMWGVGASISPYIMSFSLIQLNNWHAGYLIVAVIQIVLSFIMFFSLPLWKKNLIGAEESPTTAAAPLKLKEVLSIPGVIPCFIAFFGYCALELTTSLWASSYLVQSRGISPEIASACASLFFIGITVGRAINGFLSMKFKDKTLIRWGLGIIGVGIILILMPFHPILALIGFVVVGLGCAPVYPCIIHMTPTLFGRKKSQAIIGIEMACAYLGFSLMPPLFGLIANHISITLLPIYLLILLTVTLIMHEIVVKKVKNKAEVDGNE